MAQAIDGLFRDNRNITTQVNQVNATMERQLLRMDRLVGKAEAILAALGWPIPERYLPPNLEAEPRRVV